MCQDCGCGDPEVVPVEVQESLLDHNDRLAQHNREHFRSLGVLAVNLMGSPGSGKTALLEATARHVGPDVRLGALSGDLATERDAERLRAAGIPAAAVTTGSACHLDARLVHRALHELPLPQFDFCFVENVGNLVCPAIYDLGQAANVVALSVTGVHLESLHENLARVMPEPAVIEVSATTGAGVDAWVAWLEAQQDGLPAHGARLPIGGRGDVPGAPGSA
jgi:hydrogenase nickel incorporation protein HypB